MRPTGRPPWTDQTGGTPRPAQGRAEVHQRLGHVPRPMGAGETAGQIMELGGGSGQSCLHSMQAGHDAQHVAVDGNARRAVDDRPQRARGVGPDAGQSAQHRFVARQLPAMALDDGPGAGVQRAGAPVIAKPLPGMQHLGLLRGGKRMEARKARQERRKARLDRGYRGLLQHELADQDAIGGDGCAGSSAPGQLARVGVVPGEQAVDQPSRCRLRHPPCPPRSLRHVSATVMPSQRAILIAGASVI